MSLTISVDTGRCEAHGDCVVAAPALFDLGEDDEVVRVLDAEPDESQRAAAELAVKLCPVAAILLQS